MRIHNRRSATLPCPKCSRKFVDTRGLSKHLIEQHKTRPQYKCPDCGHISKSAAERVSHRSKFHRQRRSKVPRSAVAKWVASPRVTECKSCVIKFTTRNEYLAHVKEFHSADLYDQNQGQVRWHCPVCLKPFKNEHRFKEHLGRHQKETGLLFQYHCECCGKSLESEEALSEHLAEEHKGMYNCWTCHASYSNGTFLKSHLETHEEEGKTYFYCNFCYRGYTGKQYWAIHR